MKNDRSAAVTIVALFMFAAVTASIGLAADPSLYIIERDTIQTRNFTPIINHHTLLINLGKDPLSMDIRSPVPAGKYKEGPHYPAFLEESLLPDPMFSPLEVTPTKTAYLGKPELEPWDGSVAMIWKNVVIPPQEALIAQYDNYFGEPSLYWTSEGLDVLGLKIHTAYNVRTMGKKRVLHFSYTLENTLEASIDGLIFEAFVPVKILTESGETRLLEIEEISSSPNVSPSQTTRSDGFGRAATGTAATLWAESLPAHSKVRLFIKFAGEKTAATDKIWPLLTLRGRCLTKPVWPPTQISPKTTINMGRFSYLSYNLILQDSKVIILSEKEGKVISARR